MTGRSTTHPIGGGAFLGQLRLAINAHNANDPSVYTACGNIPAPVSQSTTTSSVMEAAPVILANFKFEPQVLEVRSGQKTSFVMTGDRFGHTFTVRSLGIDIVFPANSEQAIEIDVPQGTSGTIPFVCRFHEAAGMVGNLQAVS